MGRKIGDWRMGVRWLGHEAAVADAIAAAKSAASRRELRAEERSGFWKALLNLEGKLKPVLSVCADVPMRAAEEIVRLATAFAGSTPALVASPALGRVWIFIPKPLYDEATGVRLWALRLEELRNVAAESGGSVRVEQAPAELRTIVDPWGDPGSALHLNAGIKDRFDPDGILKPGAWF
jgi:FAD/FMN-containing dehydrogenase